MRDDDAYVNAEILKKIVGKTFVFKREGWDERRMAFRKWHEAKTVSSIEIETEPSQYVQINFNDGTKIRAFAIDDFEHFMGKVDEYGSLSEMLVDRGFSF